MIGKIYRIVTVVLQERLVWRCRDLPEGFSLFPVQASTIAPQADNLYFFILGVTAFFALGVSVAVVIFAFKSRDKTGDGVGADIHGSIPLELAWSLLPFVIAMGMFVWATAVFFQIVRPPD